MIKILRQTLKTANKWSIKRVAAFTSFWIAAIYAFVPVLYPEFEIHEFVFWGFITFSGTAMGMTVWNKKIDKPNIDGKA